MEQERKQLVSIIVNSFYNQCKNEVPNEKQFWNELNITAYQVIESFEQLFGYSISQLKEKLLSNNPQEGFIITLNTAVENCIRELKKPKEKRWCNRQYSKEEYESERADELEMENRTKSKSKNYWEQ